jgi:hypothetical protein
MVRVAAEEHTVALSISSISELDLLISRIYLEREHQPTHPYAEVQKLREISLRSAGIRKSIPRS